MVEMEHVSNLCHTDPQPDLFLLYPIACMLLHDLRLIILELRYLHLYPNAFLNMCRIRHCPLHMLKPP